jgi:hypothetical protein
MDVDEEPLLSCNLYKWGAMIVHVSVTTFVEVVVVDDVVKEEPLGGYSCSSQGGDPYNVPYLLAHVRPLDVLQFQLSAYILNFICCMLHCRWGLAT